MSKLLRKGFGVHFDAGKSTSGQRFFEDLYRMLGREAIPLDRKPTAVLFNVSAPLKAIFKAKCEGQKIALRIDGLYADRLSLPFLATFGWPLRQVLSLGLKCPRLHNAIALLANLLNANYSAFARIVLADHIIYQSDFSRRVHQMYFPRKPFHIIVNGAVYRERLSDRAKPPDGEIRLISIHDEWKPAKRIHDVVAFVQWAREEKKMPVTLTILGYTGTIAACVSPHVKTLIDSARYIRTLPRFKSFDGDIQSALLDGDMYCTFAYRDPCPNVVVEAMAHGLPVVGAASGGVPDIVGDAGVLIPMDDFAEGAFSSHRYECEFPHIDFEQMLKGVLTVYEARDVFRTRVRKRFTSDLGMDVVASRYAASLRQLM